MKTQGRLSLDHAQCPFLGRKLLYPPKLKGSPGDLKSGSSGQQQLPDPVSRLPFSLTSQWAHVSLHGLFFSLSPLWLTSFFNFYGSQSRALPRLIPVTSSTPSPSFGSLFSALINIFSKPPGHKSRTHTDLPRSVTQPIRKQIFK